MDMSDLIPIDFSNKTFIAGDSSGVYLLDFTRGTIAHLTSEFEEGIEKILLDHHGVYYNLGFEKHSSDGKKFLVYRMNKHCSDSEGFNESEYEYSYPTSRIIEF